MKRFFFVFLILLIVGVVLVAPGLMADRAANALRQSFDSMSVPGMVEVELAEVNQGWFSSKATSRIRILPGLSESLEEEDIEFEDISLNVDHVLRHGPLMWTDQGPKLALAYLETDLDAPEDASPMLQGYLAGRPLLALRTSIGFGGGSVTNISNPPIEPNTPGYETVTWDGLNGKISYQSDDLDIDIKAPRFDANMGGISGKMVGLKIEADLQKTGKSLWMGDSEFTIEEIDASGPLPSLPITIKGLSLGSEAEKGDDGGMDAEARYGVKSASFPDGVLGETYFELSYENLDLETVDRLNTLNRELYTVLGNQEALDALLMHMITEVVPELFRDDSEIEMELVVDFEGTAATHKGKTEITFSPGENAMWIARLEQKIDKLLAPQVSMEDSDIRMTLSGLDMKPIRELIEAYLQLSAQDLPMWQQQEEMAVLQEQYGRQIINSATAFSLDNLALRLSEGTLTAKGKAAFTGTAPLPYEDDKALAQRVEAELNARISDGAILWLLKQQTRPQIEQSLSERGEVDPAQVDQLAEQAAKAQLTGLITQGLLKRQGEGYLLDAEIEKGLLILNGRPFGNLGDMAP